MAKIALVGPSYQEWSLPFDPQRTVNLYPVLNAKGGKEISALYGTPGLELFTNIGAGPVRNGFRSANGRLFFVSGSQLIEVDAAGGSIVRGSLGNNTGNITIDENPFQLAICDGANVYIFTYANNDFGIVTDPDLPPAGTITFIDGFFVVNEVNSGRFYISAVLDGTSWNALDFATAETSPDNLLRVFRGIGQLWLVGETTTEIWNNTGNSLFPFEVISGAQFNTGILSQFSMVEIDKSLFWIGRDDKGIGTVYQTSGFNPVRISTPPIEQKIIEAGNFEDMLAFTYNDEGHKFYFITGGGLETSLVYDTTTNEWHERAFKNEQGEFEQHLANCHVFAFNNHIIGDRRNGNLYRMDEDFYDDAGTEIIRERISPNISNENQRIIYNRFEVDFEGGVGLQTGQGVNPMCRISISKDGGLTFGNQYQIPIGRVGAYKTQAVLRRLGVAEEICFRVRVSDPVKVVMIGGYLN